MGDKNRWSLWLFCAVKAVEGNMFLSCQTLVGIPILYDLIDESLMMLLFGSMKRYDVDLLDMLEYRWRCC
jgi:hypothetical protein